MGKRQVAFFRPISDRCKHKAVFFNSSGRFEGIKRLDYAEDLFEFKGRAYNFIPQDSSFFKFRTLFATHKFYFYQTRDPMSMPLVFDKTKDPFIDSRVYKAIVDNKLIKDLNDLVNRGWLERLLDPKVLVPLIIGIVALYYFGTGGSLT